MSTIFFYIAVSCILLHEMDAIRCKEWRIFPLNKTADEGLFIQGDVYYVSQFT